MKSFTAHMPLLTATSAFGLGRRRWSSPQQSCVHTAKESYRQLLLLLLLQPFNGLFSRTTWVRRYQKGKTSLDLNEARDDGVLGCSGISWTIGKQSAPHSRQITTPTPHHTCPLVKTAVHACKQIRRCVPRTLRQ